MHCPFCQAEDTKVIDSRLVADGSQTRRRRECEVCHSRFTTFETADLALPRVVKNDGERQPFNGSKLKRGMLRALEKRPLSSEEIDTVFGKILNEIRTKGVREIPSIKIGEIMMNALKEVDSVAYVRFASVYRDFQDIKDFSEEIDSLKNDISKHGFITTSLDDYIFYLVNNPININTENSFLNKLDLVSDEQNLARIILLKKANKFDEAYNLAIELLNRGFNPYLFYEELVFLAQVNNKLKTLKKEVGKLINKKF